jgi:hypothetical protein
MRGLLTPERIDNATAPHHLESAVAVGQHAADLVAYTNAGMQHYKRQINIPADRAPATLKPLEYIGYVLEKWELVEGSYKLVDTFYIPGREFTEYYDAEVKYGVDYRYRIRAILRWCRPHGIGVMGKDPTVVDAPGASIDPLTPNDVSYFHTEWCHEWAHGLVIDRSRPNPPDELIIQPHSEPHPTTGLPYVVVSFKLPDNPQRDINKMVLLRKLQDAEGRDVSEWQQMKEFSEELRQGTRTTIITSYEHQQDDITGTKFTAQENTTTEQYVEYGPENARFEDHDVKYWGLDGSYRYVYAALCFTRHGEESLLSDQLGCRLNPDWKKKGEFPVDFVSSAGVDVNFDTGIFGTIPEQRMRSELIFKPEAAGSYPAVVGVSVQERLAKRVLENAKYFLRVESLDTGEHEDVALTVDIQNLPDDVKVLPLQTMVAAKK